MTSELIALFAGVGSIAGFIISTSPMSFDKDMNGKKKFNGTGKSMLVVAIFLLLISFFGYNTAVSEKTENKRIIDSTAKAEDSIRRFDRDSILHSMPKASPPAIPYSPPLLQVEDANLKKRQKDSLLILIGIKNFGGKKAINISDKFCFISKFGDFFNQDYTTAVRASTELTNFAPNQKMQYKELFRPGEADTTYFYLKISYSDEGGNSQKPLRIIYFIPKKPNDETLETIGEGDFSKVKQLLIQKKYW